MQKDNNYIKEGNTNGYKSYGIDYILDQIETETLIISKFWKTHICCLPKHKHMYVFIKLNQSLHKHRCMFVFVST